MSTADGEWVNSKAGFHGYCVWVRPKDDCEAQAVTQGIMQRFTRRFPPLLMPTWQPHICLAAGIDDEASALALARQVASEYRSFRVHLSGCEVDGELESQRATIYFPWQRLRAGWVAAKGDPVQGDKNAHGDDDSLVALCRRAREILGQATHTVKFAPHLSVVYFDEDELNQQQRQDLQTELQAEFKHGTSFEVDSIHVAHTEGTPDKYRLLASFPCSGSQ